MAHELTNTDGLVLHKQAAWHGLGTIVADAPSPQEALKLAKLDWEVEQQELFRRMEYPLAGGPVDFKIKTHVANVRKDTQKVLGIVGKDWRPYQNQELADFAEQLLETGEVKCETAGSIRGGEKVWFLLKGESFAIKNRDEIFPYILVSNGFDGGTALRCTPTTVRVVCSNTLHMVIPQRESRSDTIKSVRNAAYVVHHTKNLSGRVNEARQALRMYNERLKENAELMESLANINVRSATIKKFFLEMHARHFYTVLENPKTAKDEKRRNKAMKSIGACMERFDREKAIAGATAWNMFNAYTGMIQHDFESRRKDPEVRKEAKISSNLFGINATRSIETLKFALQLAN